MNTAKWLIDLFGAHIPLNGIKILDWGCGPGRIVRHIPDLLSKDSMIFGTDYNNKSIDWCVKNINGVSFNKNDLSATLPYQNNFFNAIYGISIFTHLSLDLHFDWFKELSRVLSPGGVLIITSHGDAFKSKLTRSELLKYNSGNIVVRSRTKTGHRTFAAFHPASFIKSLLKNNNLEILNHIEPISNSNKPQQDVWVLKKK